MNLAAGWYGKIPALGDFASRRLPPAFISAWDSWLQHSMAASRAALGDRWLDTYLTSPIWRFALMPKVLDGSAWAGVLMPSVDKVGRHFPLTLALELEHDPRIDTMTMILSAESWFADLEKVALSALSADFSASDLERDLERCPFAQGADFDPEADGTIDALAAWWQHPAPDSRAFRLVHSQTALDALRSAAMRAADANSSGKTIWWSIVGATGTTEINLFAGLPSEDRFAELLLGMEDGDVPDHTQWA